MSRRNTSILDGTHVIWITPPGWQHSALMVSKPGSAELPLMPLAKESLITITAQAREHLSPRQARSIASALLKAAAIAERLQKAYNRGLRHGKVKS